MLNVKKPSLTPRSCSDTPPPSSQWISSVIHSYTCMCCSIFILSSRHSALHTAGVQWTWECPSPCAVVSCRGVPHTWQLLRIWAFLPYLQAERWACHTLIDTGRRHETPGSETKDLLLKVVTVVVAPAFFGTSSPRSKSDMQKARWHLYRQWIAL